MQASQPSSPEARSTEFVPVTGGGETTSAEALLVTAYVLMWAIFFGFVVMSWRKLARVDRRLSELQSTIEKARPGAR